MERKVLGILIFATFITSCTVQRRGSEYVWVYKQDMMGDVGNGPTYLILRSGGLYEFYSPYGGAESDWGTFEMSNDTLNLQPRKYLYSARQKMKKELDTSEVSISTIPLYFIMKKDRLIDVTEYQKYPELAPWANKKGGVHDGFVKIK